MDKWYNLGYGVSSVNTDELNTIYCQEFYIMFGKLPQPSNMSRPVLLFVAILYYSLFKNKIKI